jgi:uncharacterized membrane protein YbjE (DUF340 family)
MMTLSIFIAVITGAVAGYILVPDSFVASVNTSTSLVLCFLVFLVGLEIGSNRAVLKQVKGQGGYLLIISLCTIVGSLLGGVLGGIVLRLPMNLSLSISSGLGWSSLSGVLLTQLHSAEIGAVAFLSNVFRMVLTVVFIPIIAKYLNDYTTIAPAAATSMDTTLPVISRNTRPEIVPLSLVNGVMLSSLVPLLVPFFYGL